MNEHIKKFLNEEQDPKAVDKITSKLTDLLMKNEEIGYIGVQKKPAINVFPDSIVLTNKRIIICKPKNLGLSMDFNRLYSENSSEKNKYFCKRAVGYLEKWRAISFRTGC